MFSKIKTFFKNETVLGIALVLALGSMFLVRPDSEYLNYPDYQTLALLMSLMIIVAGFKSLGVFDILSYALLRRVKSVRSLSLALVLLCFFLSMILTNDVTLLTFVPFSIITFKIINQEKILLKVIVLETIAANLGSMATPIGNPQNLYLYSVSKMNMGTFLNATLPYALLSLTILLIATLFIQGDKIESLKLKSETHLDIKKLVIYVFLLVLCLLVVFKLITYYIALIVTLLVVLIVDPHLFKGVDYGLLFTFMAFFIFIGNIKRLPFINELLTKLVLGHELYIAILVSQIISNVPAAILLAGFSNDLCALLSGVNIGGLGTLIASLASLISFKLYIKEYPKAKGAFLKIFTCYNLLFLAALILLSFML